MRICRQGFISGRVQGVGFRQFVRRAAEAEQVEGWARNLSDGRVEVLLCGEAAAVEKVASQVGIGPAVSQVADVHWQAQPYQALSGFRIS